MGKARDQVVKWSIDAQNNNRSSSSPIVWDYGCIFSVQIERSLFNLNNPLFLSQFCLGLHLQGGEASIAINWFLFIDLKRL